MFNIVIFQCSQL